MSRRPCAASANGQQVDREKMTKESFKRWFSESKTRSIRERFTNFAGGFPRMGRAGRRRGSPAWSEKYLALGQHYLLCCL
jgi:hypothetical protein